MLKGRITNAGSLAIKRGEKFELGECKIKGEICSHLCSLFGEPVKVNLSKCEGFGQGKIETNIPAISLDLCTRTLLFEEFEDLRIKKK